MAVASKLKKRIQETPADLLPEHLAKLKWFSPVQAAAYLDVSRSTIVNLMNAGKIPYSRISARVVRFDRERLDSWANEDCAASAE